MLRMGVEVTTVKVKLATHIVARIPYHQQTTLIGSRRAVTVQVDEFNTEDGAVNHVTDMVTVEEYVTSLALIAKQN